MRHTQKKIKLLRNNSIEIKVEIGTNLLTPRLYKDKTNKMKIDKQ